MAAAALAAISGDALANPATAKDVADIQRQERYELCLEHARVAPAAARESAAQWEATGGGPFARHCAAVALIGQEAYFEAATILTETGSAPTGGLTAEERASMLRLAGDIWLRIGQMGLATKSYAAVLSMDPKDRDALIGTSRAAAADGDLPEAERALTRLLAEAPLDPEALTLRAAARRLQGDMAGALDDATAASELAPRAALAWFERGAAERATGLEAAARESWIRASTLDLDGPAGAEARHALQILDAGG
ncbi:MAG: tetratricopeptide repeat protein [Pseudomonadota bacterium]